MSTFSTAFKEYRTAAMISEVELSGVLGKSIDIIRGLENGTVDPHTVLTPNDIVTLSLLFNIDVKLLTITMSQSTKFKQRYYNP